MTLIRGSCGGGASLPSGSRNRDSAAVASAAASRSRIILKQLDRRHETRKALPSRGSDASAVRTECRRAEGAAPLPVACGTTIRREHDPHPVPPTQVGGVVREGRRRRPQRRGVAGASGKGWRGANGSPSTDAGRSVGAKKGAASERQSQPRWANPHGARTGRPAPATAR